MAMNETLLREPVQVWVSVAGTPERFVWRAQRFQVTTRPTAWIGRKSWWSTQTRVPVGVGAAVLEELVWQVQARAADGAVLTLDLSPDPEGRWWTTPPC